MKNWFIRLACAAVMLWPLGAAWLAWVLIDVATAGAHRRSFAWDVGLILAVLATAALYGWNAYLARTRWGRRIEWTALGKNPLELELRRGADETRVRL